MASYFNEIICKLLKISEDLDRLSSYARKVENEYGDNAFPDKRSLVEKLSEKLHALTHENGRTLGMACEDLASLDKYISFRSVFNEIDENTLKIIVTEDELLVRRKLRQTGMDLSNTTGTIRRVKDEWRRLFIEESYHNIMKAIGRV